MYDSQGECAASESKHKKERIGTSKKLQDLKG